MNRHSKKLVCAGLLLSFGFTAMADEIYNSAPNSNGNTMQMGNGLEIGNEISLAPGLWTLTNFEFEYYTPNATLNSSLGVDVRFYLNDGPVTANNYYSPGTLIYDSGIFFNTAAGNIPGASTFPNGADINYTSLDLYNGSGINLPANYTLPSYLTFTITFYNLGTDTIDLPLANDQAGTSFGDYWLYNNVSSQWSLLTNSAPANFIVDFQGVPEPSVLGLGAIGGVMLLGVRRLMRKS